MHSVGEFFGFTTEDCIHTLDSYYDEIGEILSTIEAPGALKDEGKVAKAQQLFQSLSASLQKDYKRGNVDGDVSQMSEVERIYFFSAVRGVNDTISTLKGSKLSRQWIDALRYSQQFIKIHLHELQVHMQEE